MSITLKTTPKSVSITQQINFIFGVTQIVYQEFILGQFSAKTVIVNGVEQSVTSEADVIKKIIQVIETVKPRKLDGFDLGKRLICYGTFIKHLFDLELISHATVIQVAECISENLDCIIVEPSANQENGFKLVAKKVIEMPPLPMKKEEFQVLKKGKKSVISLAPALMKDRPIDESDEEQKRLFNGWYIYQKGRSSNLSDGVNHIPLLFNLGIFMENLERKNICRDECRFLYCNKVSPSKKQQIERAIEINEQFNNQDFTDEELDEDLSCRIRKIMTGYPTVRDLLENIQKVNKKYYWTLKDLESAFKKRQ